MPGGANILIDASDGADAEGTMLAGLQARNIHHLDFVVITHFHTDHYGRLLALLNAGIRVEKVFVNVPDATIANRELPWGCDLTDVENVLAELRRRQIPYVTPKAGDRIFETKQGDITAGIDVLCCYDGLHTPIGATDVNDTSIVLKAFIGKTRALFTGDLNLSLGTYLAGSNLDLSADILKAPHHGIEGTVPNEFYDKVGAKAVLVPAPKNFWESPRSMRNRDYFAKHRVPVFVSGLHGDVTVTMRPDGYTVEKER
jgi:competence protein ComEC